MNNPDPTLIEITLQIEGITCSGCAMDMENVLLDTEGIHEASVNYAKGTITIKYDPDEIGEEQLIKRVGRLGFPAKKI